MSLLFRASKIYRLKSCSQRCYKSTVPAYNVKIGDFYKNQRSPSSLAPKITSKDYQRPDNDKIYPLLCNKDKNLLQISNVRSQYETDPDGLLARTKHQSFTVRGRIYGVRESGNSLCFIDLFESNERLQIMLQRNKFVPEMSKEEFKQHKDMLRRGDFISVTGNLAKSNSGEITLNAIEPTILLAPCLHPLPLDMSDVKRRRNRTVDYAAYPESHALIQARSKIITFIRDFFLCRDFIEVETPMLSKRAGGATARPFKVSANESTALRNSSDKENLYLRIAPELWLKRLIIGGFDRVFEIGKSFRNEGVDSSHNPEFTTCEFYQAYADLDNLIDTTETLLNGLVGYMTEHSPLVAHVLNAEDQGKGEKLSYTSFRIPFKRLEFVPAIEAAMGCSLPDLSCENEDEILRNLFKLFSSLGLSLPPTSTRSIPHLLDCLGQKFLEPMCNEPTFITHHPEIMAPLAKSTWKEYPIFGETNSRKISVSQRFELFIGEKEIINAYEEENSPFEQQRKLSIQKVQEDSYLEAMEWGMPPTGGWGLGIDRLVMLLTGSSTIDQVLPFGNIRHVNLQS